MAYPMWNPDKTGILVDRGNGVLAFLENGPEFESVKLSAADWHEADASQPPPIPIEKERAAMICTPAQMRLTLHRLGLKDDIQAIADSDPEASIVWEYATQIMRTSPLIDALAGDFTAEQIDDIFRAAMATDDF
jgi:hypothetical protein